MALDNNHTRYRGVCLRLWDDEKFARASDEAQLIWTHLFTNRLSNPLGCYQASIAGLAEEKNRNGRWPLKRYQAAFRECERLGFIEHDQAAMLIYFPKYFSVENKPNHPHSPNVVIRWGRIWRALPASPLKTKCRTTLAVLLGELDKGQAYSDAFEEGFREGIPEGIGVPIAKYREQRTENREQITDKKKEVERAGAILLFLNDKAGKHYAVKNQDGSLTESVKFILARIREGATDNLCRAVIIRQVKKWKGDKTMDSYLRPATLFNRTKFEQYAGEVPKEDVKE